MRIYPSPLAFALGPSSVATASTNPETETTRTGENNIRTEIVSRERRIENPVHVAAMLQRADGRQLVSKQSRPFYR